MIHPALTGCNIPPTKMKYINNNEEKVKNICSICNSGNVIKWTTRKTQNRGIIQRYRCKDCGKTFTIDDGFFRMRNAPQKITCALDLFYRGVSVRKVQEHFQAFYPHNSHFSNIYRWVIKYSKKIGKFTEKLKVYSSGAIEFDEMEYHRRKSENTKGVDKNWFIDCIDVDTRFMISSGYSKSRSQKAIKQILLNIKDKTPEIKKITTDGLTAYRNVVKKTFGYDKHNQKYNVEHQVRNASKGDGFNYKVERLHSNIRARTKTMRGFHGSISSAYYIMQGYEIYYNFIREHMAIKKCPYELACPELKLNGVNKWLSLINLSAQELNNGKA